MRVILEEYRALYSLLIFRLSTMEQRLPIVAALLSATLGGVTSLPATVQPLVFLGLPPALVWLLRTTLGHARSKQDVKTRLDEIERTVNQMLGSRLMAFQSRHPSREGRIAGRTGRELILSVFLASLGLLTGCVLLYSDSERRVIDPDVYLVVCAVCGLWMCRDLLQLGRYRPRHDLVIRGEED